ncbi:endonuclease [Arenibacter sp. GZD96]|uniref:endonuclease/exonuclease/phosphatase family protein n=1 Tax=Aurantibrevibacter litoralis TaxID=3106030 RepID=UPI002AFF6561|nr:hypothetical protein [Arenibacter sp. GZD-96]MEA1787513.1 endonuclease [Arenibacter sp. GZD-96]
MTEATTNSEIHTVAFYNVENLFDLENDPNTLDDDFTPLGQKKWNGKRYKNKVHKVSKTISEIGLKNAQQPPTLLGMVEVENDSVVRDVLATSYLRRWDYDLVHFDSPDERGIDTALVYQKKYFDVLHAEPIPLVVHNTNGEPDRTRDILYVHGKLNGEEVHVFVNHWPSRREGAEFTEFKRIKASETIKTFAQRIETQYENPNYLIMGDFNDDPHSASMQSLLELQTLYNPMDKLVSPMRGTLNYKANWNLFDQIILSHSFFNFEKQTHSFAHANIFDPHFLTEWEGKVKGNPFRTYAGNTYLGGYSDHFPVYIQLKYHP